jgi:hypothetical protein
MNLSYVAGHRGSISLVPVYRVYRVFHSDYLMVLAESKLYPIARIFKCRKYIFCVNI